MPCLIFLREAERDESRMVSSLCMRRNMINHAPTAHALPYSTYPFLRILPIPLATFKENVYIYGEILYDCYALFFITMTPSASYRTQARVIQCSY